MPIVWLPNDKTEPINTVDYSTYHSSGSQEYISSPDDSMHVSNSDAEANEQDPYQNYSYNQQYNWDYNQYHNSANTNQIPAQKYAIKFYFVAQLLTVRI